MFRGEGIKLSLNFRVLKGDWIYFLETWMKTKAAEGCWKDYNVLRILTHLPNSILKTNCITL